MENETHSAHKKVTNIPEKNWRNLLQELELRPNYLWDNAKLMQAIVANTYLAVFL